MSESQFQDNNYFIRTNGRASNSSIVSFITRNLETDGGDEIRLRNPHSSTISQVSVSNNLVFVIFVGISFTPLILETYYVVACGCVLTDDETFQFVGIKNSISQRHWIVSALR